MPECRRSNDPSRQCPQAHPDQPWLWCHGCRAALDFANLNAWLDDACGPSHVAGEEPEEPPCPLESHQQEAYQSWLTGLDDPPCYSLKQVSEPSAN